MGVFVDDAEQPSLISNEHAWPSGVMDYHALDMVVCVAGLAANVASSFQVFFADVRKDLCAARNRVSQKALVADFDDQVLSLPATDER